MMIHLYAGDGKGKTSAAAGLAVRMTGHGRRVLFCRFLKGESGEVCPLQKLCVQVMNAPHTGKFTFQMLPDELSSVKAANMNFIEELRGIIHDVFEFAFGNIRIIFRQDYFIAYIPGKFIRLV